MDKLVLQVQSWNVGRDLKNQCGGGVHGGLAGFVLGGKRASEIISIHPSAQAPSRSSLPHVMGFILLLARIY